MNKTKNILKNSTIFLFLLLATFPALKENYISILLIITSLLVLTHHVVNKTKITLKLDIFLYTGLFWLFLLRELVFFELTLKVILFHLVFLIVPLLFYFKPKYINTKIKQKSFNIFQITLLFLSFYYLIFFISSNSTSQLFEISNENIPYFRDYVGKYSVFHIHPTYFSAYLLISFTISYVFLINNNKKLWRTIFDLLNTIVSVLFIFIFSSKIVLLSLLFTVFFIPFSLRKSVSIKKKLTLISIFVIVLLLGSFSFKRIIFKRFNEIKTEMNKPIKGLYYNSVNIRVAIIKCSFDLIKQEPFLGYGSKTQKELNNCYAANNDSDFYLKTDYNTHNYYMHLILYGGWLMLLFFSAYLLFLFSKIKYSFLAITIFLQILIISITENYLSRQFGAMTFNYFIMTFIFIKNKTK